MGAEVCFLIPSFLVCLERDLLNGSTNPALETPAGGDDVFLTNNSSALASSADLEQSLIRLNNSARLAHLATVGLDGLPHVNTCYFALEMARRLIILTPPSSIHSTNFAHQPVCAVAVAKEPGRVGDKIHGAQLRCRARLLDAQAFDVAYGIYSAKFPEFADWAPSGEYVLTNFSSRFYGLEIESGKLIDEAIFGDEKYIHFRAG